MGKLSSKLSKIVLSALMAFSLSSVNPVIAEETTPTETPVTETVEQQNVEEPVEITEAPSEAAAEPSAEAIEELPDTTEEPVAEPMVTPEVTAEATSVPTESTEEEECETCTINETTEVPEEIIQHAQEETLKQVQEALNGSEETEEAVEKVITEAAEAPEWAADETSAMDVYVAENAADYVAALATLTDSPSKRLIVTTDQRISDVLTFGKGVYYDGNWIVAFDTEEETASAKEILIATYGEENVIEDSTITVQEVAEGQEENADTFTVEDLISQYSNAYEAGDTETMESIKATVELLTEEDQAAFNEAIAKLSTESETIEVVESGESEPAFEIDQSNKESAEEGLTVHETTDQEEDVKLVAVIDTGANEGADITINLTDDPMEDANGHGTEIVETIKQIAPNAKVISIKAINDQGYGSLATATQAVSYAIEANVDIINISAVARDYGQAEAFKAEIQEALDKGITVVVAAGNYHTDVAKYAPANMEGVNTIGAARQYGGISESAFAAQYFSNYGTGVDFWYIADSTSNAAAQETGILAAGLENEGWDTTNTWYRFTKVVYQDGQGNSEDAEQVEYEEMTQAELTAQGCYNPSCATGNITPHRQGPMVNGTYPNTTFSGPDGISLTCGDSSVLADYSKNYSAKYESSSYDETVYYTYPDSNYTGSVIHHSASLSGMPEKYVAGRTYYLTNEGNSNLSEDGYYIKSITAETGDVSAITAYISGNTVVFSVNEAAADMPEGITIEIDTNKQIIGTCTVTFSTTITYLTGYIASGSQPFNCTPVEVSRETNKTAESCEDTHLYSGTSVSTEVNRGGITFDKDDLDHSLVANVASAVDGNAQGDATLQGAEFTITNARNGLAVAKITTGVDGTPEYVTSLVADFGIEGNHAGETVAYKDLNTKTMLKYGDYLIQETKAPSGYNLNTEWSYSFSIRNQDGNIVNATNGTVSWTDGDGDGYLDMPSQSSDVTYGTDSNGGRVLDDVIRGGFEITKYDTDRYADGTKRYTSNPSGSDVYNTPQGDASLAGATYEVYNASDASINADGSSGGGNGSSNKLVYVYHTAIRGATYAKMADANGGAWYAPGEKIMTITTAESGYFISNADTLPYGTYTIKETAAPIGYVLNSGWSVTFRIREEGKIFNVIDLAGDLTTNSATTNSVKAKAEDGSKTGHNYVYDANTNGVITADFMMDDVIRGGVKFLKTDYERDKSVAQGDATLEGAHIAIVNASTQDVMVNGHFYEPGEIVYELVTDENGTCSSTADLLPYGSYYAIETQAPVGYLVNTDWKVEFTIREDGSVLDFTGNDVIEEQVIRGDVRVYKYDYETDTSSSIGGYNHSTKGDDMIETNRGHVVSSEIYQGATLADIWFEIKNVSSNSILVQDTSVEGGYREVASGDVVTYISTHWDDELGAYAAETTNKYLPYGTYEIRELSLAEVAEVTDPKDSAITDNFTKMDDEEKADSSNNSYRFTDGTARTFQIGNHSYGPVTINTSEAEVDGLITNTGATGTLSYVQSNSDNCKALSSSYVAYNPKTGAVIPTDLLEDVAYAADGTSSVKTLSFHKDAETTTSNVATPMSDLVEKDGTIKSKNGAVAQDSTLMIFKNQVKRNNFEFIKKDSGNYAMETLWVLENRNTGERHVLYTNSQGKFSTTSAKHSKNTNANDKFLELYDNGIPVDLGNKADNYGAGSVVVSSGIWFGLTEDGGYASVDDSLGALPYGVYTLTEIPTTNNTSGLQKNIEVIISQDTTIDSDGYDGGTIVDAPIEATSHALNYQIDSENGSHEGKADGTVATIRDVVTFSGEGIREATAGDYVLVGKFWNKTKGEFVKDADGKVIISAKQVQITSDDKTAGTATYENEFTIENTGSLVGCEIVAYEDLYTKTTWDKIQKTAGNGSN